MQDSQTILHTIIDVKRQEVIEQKRTMPFTVLEELTATIQNQGGFIKAIETAHNKQKMALIAEIKKASPSKGVIREDFNPLEIAQSYTVSHADCLSVLTDKQFFQGDIDFIKQVRTVSSLPILRKDFIVDAYQLYESKYYGADAILLILSALEKTQYVDFLALAQVLHLDVLVEVHDQAEMDIALESSAQLIGINNRNLKTFEVSLENTFHLLKNNNIYGRLIISESGIETNQQVQQLFHHGVHGILVGETLMKAPDIAKAVKNLME